jgi:hypothetical protein
LEARWSTLPIQFKPYFSHSQDIHQKSNQLRVVIGRDETGETGETGGSLGGSASDAF